MPIDFDVCEPDRTIYAFGSGVLELDDVVGFLRDCTAHPEFDHRFDRLIDLSNVTDINVGYRQVSLLLAEHGDFIGRACSGKCALVATTPLVYGMVRMMQSMAPQAARIEVFRDVTEARNFLDAEQAPSDARTAADRQEPPA